MTTENLEYFIESLGGKSFNLWARKNSKYFNMATLFFQDSSCGTQWDVSNLENSVSYDLAQINDELESPLAKISAQDGTTLVQMADKSPEEVAKYAAQLNLSEKI